MENVTVGGISDGLVLIAGILGSGGLIIGFLSKYLRKIIKEMLNPIEKKVDNVSDQVTRVDIENCKNYLEQSISYMKEGHELGEVAKQRFHEVYDHYSEDLHQNSWVHTEYENLKKEGKL